MLTQILGWTGTGLLLVLLVRALRGGFVGKYPVFYAYVGYVFLRSLVLFYLYTFHPQAYQFFYWSSEFLTVALGSCVIWEIYVQALAAYPGVARLARSILIGLFVLVVARVLASRLGGSLWPLQQTAAELERDLRVVQTLLLLVIVSLLLYYSIPVGRNLGGILLGYGFFIGAALLQLAWRTHLGDAFQAWWHYLEPLAYDVTLVIWCIGLWSYAPVPLEPDERALEEDYELLASRTETFLTRVWSQLLRGVRG